MNTANLSPYARGALEFDEKRRLAFHVSSLRLHASGSHPGKTSTYRTWLTDRHGNLRGKREDVPTSGLFAAIESLLDEAGEPLPNVDQWADIWSVVL